MSHPEPKGQSLLVVSYDHSVQHIREPMRPGSLAVDEHLALPGVFWVRDNKATRKGLPRRLR